MVIARILKHEFKFLPKFRVQTPPPLLPSPTTSLVSSEIHTDLFTLGGQKRLQIAATGSAGQRAAAEAEVPV